MDGGLDAGGEVGADRVEVHLRAHQPGRHHGATAITFSVCYCATKAFFVFKFELKIAK